MIKYKIKVSEIAEQDLAKRNEVFIVRIGHAFMDWEKYLKDE